MEDPTLIGNKRNADGTFANGNPGGPGRPTGSVSIVAKIKQKFLENPEYFEEWVIKLMDDPKERRAIMEQLDGKPKQSVELGGKDGAPIEVITGMRIIKEDGIDFKSKNEKQLQAASYWIDDETEELVYGGAKYGGKSYLGASMIFGDALIYPGTHYFIARQELIDLRKYTIPTIHEVFEHWGLKLDQYAHFNGQDSYFQLTNGSRVYLITCKEVPSDLLFERFGSMQMTRGWIEEGGQIKEAAKRNLALSVGRWKNDVYRLKKKLLITCNPKKGWLKREYVEPWKTDTLPPSKKFIQAFATDNKHGNTDYIKSLSEEKDLVTRQRLWEGNWDYDDDIGALMKYDNIRDLFTNNIVKDGQKYLVVDVARYAGTKRSLTSGMAWRVTNVKAFPNRERIRPFSLFGTGQRNTKSRILTS